MASKRVIVDMDNTMGVPGCDIDDMLSLLMLLGSDDIVVEGVCTTYGNSTLETVHANTQRLFSELALDIPLAQGAACPEQPIAPAAEFLAHETARNPGELTVLATGSLTNLKGAAALDEGFYENVRGVVLMGGYTQSLFLGGVAIDELNTSCDPQATYGLLASGCDVTVATAQNCLPASFTRTLLEERFGAGSWLLAECGPWFDAVLEHTGQDGWVCWDVVAAAMLAAPQLFEPATMDVALNRRWLSVGYFEHTRDAHVPSARISVPRIADADAFRELVIERWHTALARLGKE